MLERIFDRNRSTPRLAFIPYLMAGDPDVETTAALLQELTRSGAAAIELGIPYGDPLADGPTIAAAGTRALARGVRIDDVLELARAAASRTPTCAPIVLFSYYNPIYQYGIGRFARAAAEAGVAGVIVPDVALEEVADLQTALASEGLDMPLLIAPSTRLERARRIASAATGFVYVVSRLGVTGADVTQNVEALREQIAALRTVTDKPLAVGFGISRAEHVRAILGLADGFIVGSALIDAYAGTSGSEAAGRVRTFVKSLYGRGGRP
ncbi:MAG: tryptophan synthase subunit alpha [Candidatus Eremiobacteraeota bacterium]|nr:tryptophan synthase subunit alpha [Candidatus Eremiobacteraeota bacterium]